MSDVAWKKFVGIRKKWDPKGLIGGYREGGQEMNKLNLSRSSKL